MTSQLNARIAAAAEMGKPWIGCWHEGPDGFVCTERLYAAFGWQHTGDHRAVGRAEGERDSEVCSWPQTRPAPILPGAGQSTTTERETMRNHSAKHARRRTPVAPKLLSLLAAVGALFAVVVTPAAAVNPDAARAAAVVQPTANTVVSSTIKDGQVYGWDMADNTVPWSKLGSQLRGEIRAAQGPIVGNLRIAPGTVFSDQLSAEARRQLTYAAALSEPAIITKVGGPINANGTRLDAKLALKHGTYLVTVSGQIDRTTAAATPGKQTQPQLSLWLDKNRDGEFTWQTEGSISPNATIPDLAGRSATVSGQTCLKVEQSTPLDVGLVAFGYNNDASAAGSGELTVSSALISAIPVTNC